MVGDDPAGSRRADHYRHRAAEQGEISERLSQADHELRSLIRFGFGLGINADAVREAYHQVCVEADRLGDVTDEERMAEVRRRLLAV